jgi:hypothetical protein
MLLSIRQVLFLQPRLRMKGFILFFTIFLITRVTRLYKHVPEIEKANLPIQIVSVKNNMSCSANSYFPRRRGVVLERGGHLNDGPTLLHYAESFK